MGIFWNISIYFFSHATHSLSRCGRGHLRRIIKPKTHEMINARINARDFSWESSRIIHIADWSDTRPPAYGPTVHRADDKHSTLVYVFY